MKAQTATGAKPRRMDKTGPQSREHGEAELLASNRELWNQWTDVHVESDFYAVDRFLEGESSLQSIELEEMGEVDGKSLLHLQCHFGLDTLSWARRGARVTGVDLSPRAVSRARDLASRAGLEATFHDGDVLELDLGRGFDVVFTSYGVLDWLQDLDRWAAVVAAHLKPGGLFYMVEFHPVLGLLDDRGRSVEGSYFPADEPVRFKEQGTYADPDAAVGGTSYTWPHSLAEILSALLNVGLRLESFREFDFSPYDCFPFTQEVAPGRSVIPGLEGKVPLCFSVRARAAGADP